MERLLSAASFYSLIFLFIMFTSSQLLDKINNHISEIQFTRTPKGLFEPIEYIPSTLIQDVSASHPEKGYIQSVHKVLSASG